MKAIIMAGGEGTRLRPLTCDCPKPMARLCGRPVLEYILELLAKNGVDEAAITLRYRPEDIVEYFPDQSYAGVHLRFVEEDEPLGTAGGVKNAAREAQEDLIVISGDALCDFDLAAAAREHRERGAAATLVLSHVADPREYGLVVTEPSGRVRGFVEKPGWAQSVTDAVNTGIYVLSPLSLSLIPDGKPFDFAKDLFPLMLSKGLPVYGFDADGYWCDIGDIGAYVSCQGDMLEEKVECRLPGSRKGTSFCKTMLPPGSFTVIPPVYIGENVKIGDYAQIGPDTVIDDGCTIGYGTTVRNSVVLQNVLIGDRCELRGALVCAGASLGKRAGMFEGSVAGAGSVIGRDAAVSPGVKIWPGKRVEDGARASVNIKYGAARRGVFDDDGISGEIGIDLTPELCARLGAAVGGAVKKTGVAFDGSNVGRALRSAFSAGALSAGAQVIDFGECFEAQLLFAVPFCGLPVGVFACSAGSRAVLRLCDGAGLTLTRSLERKIESTVSTGEISRCGPGEYGEPEQMAGIRAIYTSRLAQTVPEGLQGMKAVVRSANRAVQRRLSALLSSLGCAEGGIRVHLTVSGGAVSFFDENGAYLDAARSLALGCLVSFENGEDVALPYSAPRIIDSIAQQNGRRVLRYLSCPADDGDRQARLLAARQPWVRDGLAAALRILGYLKQNDTTLSAFAAKLPPFALAVKAVELAGNPGRLLRGIGGGQEGPSEGVLLSVGQGKVLLSPLKRGTGLRIMAEAADMEAADELCARLEERLRRDEPLDRSAKQD